jgi:methylated-DNA-[protein]-cysteine S-methyltransferase
MNTLVSTTLTTALGPFTVIASDDSVVAAGFAASPDELGQLLRHKLDVSHVAEFQDLGELSGAVGRYFAGDLDALDSVPVVQAGSPFQQASWVALRNVRAGERVSYRQLAARTKAGSARAAGSACASNSATLFVPCHRVVRSSGELGGYLWGLDRKRWLLDHERRSAA